MDSSSLFTDLARDARIALRSLPKQPTFLLAVLLSLGLGIGGNVAMFGIMDASLFTSLPYPDSEELVMGRVTWLGEVGNTVSGPDFFDYRDQAGTFQELAAFTPFGLTGTIAGGSEPERVRYALVSTGFFRTLGVEPFLGRAFLEEEGEAGGPDVVVLEHGYWQRRYGGDPQVVGSTLILEGRPYTTVGVMPQGFRFQQDVDVWRPLQRGGDWAQARQYHNFVLVGRLRGGADVGGAQAEVDRISTQLAETYPDTNRDKGLHLTPLREALSESYRGTLVMLMGAVVLLLLVACGNVAGLLLARGTARRGEMAIRSAMGAGRGRLTRFLLTENLLLALAAGVFGVVLVVWIQRGILGFVSLSQVGGVQPGISPRALGFALVLSLVTVALFGVLPSIRTTVTDPAEELRSGVRSAGNRGTTRFLNGLVVAQVTTTAILLVMSGLLVRSVQELRKVDPGFRTEGLLTASLDLPADEYGSVEARAEFFNLLRGELEALPGVDAVGFVSQLPIVHGGNNIRVARPEEFGTSGVFGTLAFQRRVTPGYFEAMGVPLLSGRDVALTDGVESAPVVVISEGTAEAVFGDENPLGQVLAADWGGDEPVGLEVVGVVGDVSLESLAWGQGNGIYYSFPQSPQRVMRLTLRTPGDPLALVPGLRSTLRTVEPDALLSDVASMDELITGSLGEERAVSLVLGIFALVALLMAAVGIYGVLAYQVSRRIHEIGVRVALGASLPEVARGVLFRGMSLVAFGLVLALPGAYLAGRLIQGMLFGVGTLDLLTYAGVSVFLVGVSVVACLVPARRAARVDPVEAFRVG
jgi:putative ABC transport system permease protein